MLASAAREMQQGPFKTQRQRQLDLLLIAATPLADWCSTRPMVTAVGIPAIAKPHIGRYSLKWPLKPHPKFHYHLMVALHFQELGYFLFEEQSSQQHWLKVKTVDCSGSSSNYSFTIADHCCCFVD